MKYSVDFISMKRALVIILIFSVVLTVSCDSKQFEEKDELPRAKGYEKVVEIDGCEYIEYQSVFYCGHQYNHHEYRATLLTHKGDCVNHELRSEYESNLNKKEHAKYSLK